jgi:hypothetical protein
MKWIQKQTLRHELPPSQRYANIMKTEKAIETQKQFCVLFTDSKLSKSRHGLICMKVNKFAGVVNDNLYQTRNKHLFGETGALTLPF